MSEQEIPVALGLAGVGAILLASGVTGNSLSQVFQGNFTRTVSPDSGLTADAAAQATSPDVVGAVSGAGWAFPLLKAVAGKPGTWTNDQGVDITAPGGSPLLAMKDGVIVKKGIGGFGPDAPVLQIGPKTWIYYGHAGPCRAVGTHVKAGRPLGIVGFGRVGMSTGPHLEIGFCDSNGTPIGSQAASMHAMLLSTYGGK